MKVECGSKPGFSTSGWMATSTYQVRAREMAVLSSKQGVRR